MNRFLTILFLFISILSWSQITAEKTSYDFGEIYAEEETYVDFKFTNTTDKSHFLLTVDKPRGVFYIFSSKTIAPDSSMIIRFKIDANRKGKFQHEIDVYFSANQEPITIRLFGNVKEVSNNPLNDCPDFSSTPSKEYATGFQVTIKVIDSLTREPIKNAKVYLVERGELVGDHKTNNKGVVQKIIPLGWYYITANHEDYNENYYDGYLNFKRNVVIIELSQDPEEMIVEVEEETEEEEEEIVVVVEEEGEETQEEIIDIVNEPVEEEIVEEVEIVNDDPTPWEELPDTLFDEKHFKYSNITFILDVSTSMSGNGKLALLRMSMIELTKILRPNDIVSIIKYSSNTEVILKNTSGANKEEIITTVKELKASGLTAGGSAIKLGYKTNKKTHLDNGNNIVIMITDGAFNKGDKNYRETIKNTFAKKGTKFSVVGIKMSEYLTPHMQAIVADGGGAFVQIRTIEEAQKKLINEIKRTAFRSS